MHPLAVKAVVSAVGWALVHKVVGDGLLMSCVPAGARKEVEEKKADGDLRNALAVNGVAFIHACLIVPLGLWGAFFAQSLVADPFNGTDPIVDLMFVFMLGYFLWDSVVCIVHYRSFGITFLLHGVICFISLYVQQVAKTHRCNWFLCILALSEISTPVLHIRYVLLQGKASDTLLFKFANFTFLLLFVSVRLVAIVWYTVPLMKEVLFDRRQTLAMSAGRRAMVATDYVLWLGLNYFWAALLGRSQWKQIRKAHP